MQFFERNFFHIFVRTFFGNLPHLVANEIGFNVSGQPAVRFQGDVRVAGFGEPGVIKALVININS